MHTERFIQGEVEHLADSPQDNRVIGKAPVWVIVITTPLRRARPVPSPLKKRVVATQPLPEADALPMRHRQRDMAGGE